MSECAPHREPTACRGESRMRVRARCILSAAAVLSGAVRGSPPRRCRTPRGRPRSSSQPEKRAESPF
eukprot:6193684-Pleurochrysis_carterae.AAC.2